MSAARITRPPKLTPEANGQPSPRLFRITLQKYHEMGRAGILSPKDRCELIHGVLVEKPVVNPPHASTVRKLARVLIAWCQDVAIVGIQQPISLPPDNEPEPEVAIFSGTEGDYDDRHPGPRDVLLVVVVSDSSLPEDRTTKLKLYASYKLPVYWIVNIPERRIEVYTDPKGGKSPTYRTRTDYGPDDSVPVALAGKALGSIPVRELLP